MSVCGHFLMCLNTLSYLMCTKIMWVGQGRYYFSHFKEEEIEPQRGLKDLLEVHDLRSVNRGAALPVCGPVLCAVWPPHPTVIGVSKLISKQLPPNQGHLLSVLLRVLQGYRTNRRYACMHAHPCIHTRLRNGYNKRIDHVVYPVSLSLSLSLYIYIDR